MNVQQPLQLAHHAIRSHYLFLPQSQACRPNTPHHRIPSITTSRLFANPPPLRQGRAYTRKELFALVRRGRSCPGLVHISRISCDTSTTPKHKGLSPPLDLKISLSLPVEPRPSTHRPTA